MKIIDFIPKTVLSEQDKTHMVGRENWIIRMYYYLESGVGILNNFRNLFLGILGLYLVLKLDNYLWLFAMTFPSVILLIIVGRYNVHKLSKLKEWLNMRFSTHYGIKSFNYTEKQTELLEEIRDLLKNLPK